MPNSGYTEMRKYLVRKMRGVLTDLLIEVHSRCCIPLETQFLCIDVIDRFLPARVASLVKLQLVGVACVLIAVKVEEIISPAAANSLYCTDSSYSETKALQAKRYVLKTVDRNVSFPNPTYFLRQISNVYQHHIQIRPIAEYLTGIRCLESDLCTTLLPCGVLGRKSWVRPYLSPTHLALLNSPEDAQSCPLLILCRERCNSHS